MIKSILISRPDHDLINTYFFHWSQDVIDAATRHQVKTLDLAGNKAIKKNLISYLKKHRPVLIFLNGHGNRNCIAGYNDEILLESTDNLEKFINGTIMYVRSCEVGAAFGEIAIKKHVLAFIGYTKKYTLCTSKGYNARPLRDRVAQLFLKPSNLIPISLIKGNIAKDAYRKSQNAMIRNIRFMLSTGATQEQKDALPYLWSNRKHQVILGNNNACIK